MAKHPGNSGIEWRGDWHDTEYMGLMAGSPTFRKVAEEWDGPAGPSTFILRSIGLDVGEDLFMSYTSLLIEYSKLDVALETQMRLPNHGWNVLHVAALHGWTRTPSFLHRQLRAQVDVSEQCHHVHTHPPHACPTLDIS